MNPPPPNINPNSVERTVSFSASNMNATLIQAFNPPAVQTLQQVALDGVFASDAHGLATTSQHAANTHSNGLGMQPPQIFPGLVAAQMGQFVEQGEPALGNHERMGRWSGTIAWRGTDPVRNERTEVRAQVTATSSKGDPLASTWPDFLLLAPAGPAVPMDKLNEWIRKNDPVVMDIRPTSEMDLNSYGQLVKLLRYKNCYAIAGWTIPGKGHSMNLLIALSTQGLIGAAFPTTGIPEIPKPRLAHGAAFPTTGTHDIHKPRSAHVDPAVLIVGRNGSGMNTGASLKTAGGVDERMNRQWSGTLTWQGTDATSNERKEMCAQVTATTTKGNSMASTWPKVLTLAPAGPAVSMDELHEWMRKYSPAVTHIEPTPGTDGDGCGQLVKLLRDKGCYAVAGWRIPMKARSTMNLLIAPFSQGLLGAVFPTSGMPEIPRPRLPPLDPGVRQTILNFVSPQIRNLPEPQLSQAIRQIFLNQQRTFNAVQGGFGSLT